MCHDDSVTHFSQPVNEINKKVDFDVNFDDEKLRKTVAEQNIAKKDSIQISFV
jgi:hypothetical protein